MIRQWTGRARIGIRVSSVVRVLCLVGAMSGWVSLAQAQTLPQALCQNPAAPRINIVYVNGVTTTMEEARINAGKLERTFLAAWPTFPSTLQAFCYEFQLNYNPTSGEVRDFAEAGQQRFGLSSTVFWESLHSLTVLSPLLGDMQTVMTDANQIDQATIQRHADRYRQAMLAPSCRRVLVVPHSQGNLYTNEAYDLVFAGPPPTPSAGALKIVGVATPDTVVKGNGRYRSSSGDTLINAIRLTLPPTLPANTNWGSTLLPLLTPANSGGHSFVGYLMFDPSRADLISDIQASLMELAAVNPCP